MLLRSAIFVLILMAIQGVVNSQPSLFGTKVSSLGAGIVQFYPRAAIFETLKIALAAITVTVIYSVWLWAVCSVSPGTATKVGRTKVVHRDKIRQGKFIFLLVAVVSWVLVTLGSMIEYPALYEPGVPHWCLQYVHTLAGVASPLAFKLSGILILLVPVIRVFRVRNTTKVNHGGAFSVLAVVSAVAASMALAGLCLIQPSKIRLFAPDREAPPKQPHIIWIAVDSLRLDRLETPGLLPAISAFRADERTVEFRRHHVGVPRTFPSWIEMIQGRYSAETGVRHMFPGFPPRDESFEGIVSLAQSSGYRTIAVSDFAGDIFPRFSTGFDDIRAPGMSLGTVIRQNIDQMFPLFLPLVTAPIARSFFPALKSSPAYAAPEHLEESVASALDDARSGALDDVPDDVFDATETNQNPAKFETREIGEGRSAGQPIFLTLFYSTAHFPYAAPWPYYKKFSSKDYKGPFWFQKNPSLTVADQELGPEQVQQVRALYDGALQAVDDSFARLVADLKMRGIWDDAIVVLTADHGEDLFEEGILQGHGDHLRGDQSLRVPWLIKLPAGQKVPQQRIIDSVSRSIDIAPTLAALAGIEGFPEPAHELRGHDLTVLMNVPEDATVLRRLSWSQRNKVNIARSLPAYSETEIWFARTGDVFYQKNRLDYPGISQLLVFDPGRSGEVILNPKYEKMIVLAKHRSLIFGQWKLIYMPTTTGVKYELYDVVADPWNKNDLARKEPDALRMMKSRLLGSIRRIEDGVRIMDDFILPGGM